MTRWGPIACDAAQNVDAGWIDTLLKSLSDGGFTYGVIFGLAGFAIQMVVRKEWPGGGLNEGSPQTLDPTKFGMALVTSIAISIAAAYWLKEQLSPTTVTARYVITIMVFGYVGGDLMQILKVFADLLKQAKDKLAALLPASHQSRNGRS